MDKKAAKSDLKNRENRLILEIGEAYQKSAGKYGILAFSALY
jgi:hypothetical protein